MILIPSLTSKHKLKVYFLQICKYSILASLPSVGVGYSGIIIIFT